MAKQTIEQLVEGGKASGGPPLGPAIGPMGLNINEVVEAINAATKEFKGMKIPVTLTIDTDTKKYEISVGTPPTSSLVKKEAGVEKAASNPKIDRVGDLAIEQVIKIAQMKKDVLLGKDNITLVKEVIGTCQSMGIAVEGKSASDVMREIEEGKYREKIISAKTELTEEEKKHLEEEKERIKKEMEERRAEFEEKARAILEKMEGKPKKEIEQSMQEAELPREIYEPMLPAEEGAVEAESAESKDAGGADKKEEAAPKDKDKDKDKDKGKK